MPSFPHPWSLLAPVLHQALILTDKEGRILDYNRPTLAILGHASAPYQQKSLPAFVAGGTEKLLALMNSTPGAGLKHIKIQRPTDLTVPCRGIAMTCEMANGKGGYVFCIWEGNGAVTMEGEECLSLGTDLMSPLVSNIAHDIRNVISAVSANTEIAHTVQAAQDPDISHSLDQILRACKQGRVLADHVSALGHFHEAEAGTFCLWFFAEECASRIESRLAIPLSIVTSGFQPRSMVLQGDMWGLAETVFLLARRAWKMVSGIFSLELRAQATPPCDWRHPDTADAPIEEYAFLSVCFDAPEKVLLDLQTALSVFRYVGETGKEKILGLARRGEGPTIAGAQEALRGMLEASFVRRSLWESGALFGQTVESNLRFCLHIALRREKQKHLVQPPPPRGALPPKGRILFVEDEEGLRELFVELLESAGYTVEACGTAGRALSLFCANPEIFDAALVDFRLPDGDGIRLARRLLEQRDNLPVLLCSGDDSLQTLRKAREAGIQDVLAKPLSRAALEAALESVISENSKET